MSPTLHTPLIDAVLHGPQGTCRPCRRRQRPCPVFRGDWNRTVWLVATFRDVRALLLRREGEKRRSPWR